MAASYLLRKPSVNAAMLRFELRVVQLHRFREALFATMQTHNMPLLVGFRCSNRRRKFSVLVQHVMCCVQRPSTRRTTHRSDKRASRTVRVVADNATSESAKRCSTHCTTRTCTNSLGNSSNRMNRHETYLLRKPTMHAFMFRFELSVLHFSGESVVRRLFTHPFNHTSEPCGFSVQTKCLRTDCSVSDKPARLRVFRQTTNDWITRGQSASCVRERFSCP